MLDRLSQQLLEELNRKENADNLLYDFDTDLSEIAESLHVNGETLRAAIRFLHEQGYVKYQTSGGHVIGFSLDHKGLHWREFRRQEIIKYLEEKWIDFAALLLSVIALICSLT